MLNSPLLGCCPQNSKIIYELKQIIEMLFWILYIMNNAIIFYSLQYLCSYRRCKQGLNIFRSHMKRQNLSFLLLLSDAFVHLWPATVRRDKVMQLYSWFRYEVELSRHDLRYCLSEQLGRITWWNRHVVWEQVDWPNSVVSPKTVKGIWEAIVCCCAEVICVQAQGIR